MDPVAKNGPVDPLSGNDKIRGCLLAGDRFEGRGDCSHFVGLPKIECYPETTDAYGVPHGWCIVCWHGEIISRLHERLRVLSKGLKKD